MALSDAHAVWESLREELDLSVVRHRKAVGLLHDAMRRVGIRLDLDSNDFVSDMIREFFPDGFGRTFVTPLDEVLQNAEVLIDALKAEDSPWIQGLLPTLEEALDRAMTMAAGHAATRVAYIPAGRRRAEANRVTGTAKSATRSRGGIAPPSDDGR